MATTIREFGKVGIIPKHVLFLFINTFSGATRHKNTVNVNNFQTLQYLHTSVVKRKNCASPKKIKVYLINISHHSPKHSGILYFFVFRSYFLICLLVFSFLIICVLCRLLSWFQKLANVVILNYYKNKKTYEFCSINVFSLAFLQVIHFRSNILRDVKVYKVFCSFLLLLPQKDTVCICTYRWIEPPSQTGSPTGKRSGQTSHHVHPSRHLSPDRT